MDFAEIARVAALGCALAKSGSDEDDHAFNRGLNQVGRENTLLVTAAMKLMEGKMFHVNSDDPRRIEQCKALALYLGGDATDEDESHWAFKDLEKPVYSVMLFPLMPHQS